MPAARSWSVASGVDESMDARNDHSLPPSAVEELGYWEHEFAGNGTNAAETKKRLDPARRHESFPPLVATLLPVLRQAFASSGPLPCFELGSGPMSTLAHGVETGQLAVTAVDVLADHYAELLRRHGLDYPVRPVRGAGETLLEQFPGRTFPLVYASNSLDHTDDLPRAFDNLVRLTAPGGVLVLQHHLTEGSHRNWSDSHHWDLDLGNRGLRATHRTGGGHELGQRADLEVVYLCYRSYALDGWIDVVYRRRPAADSMSPAASPQ